MKRRLAAAGVTIAALITPATHANAAPATTVAGGISLDHDTETWFLNSSPATQKAVVAAWAKTGARYIRVDAYMYQLEAQPGHYTWATDPEIHDIDAAGLQVDLVLSGPPPWALNADGYPNLTDWATYTHTVANQYPAVHTYEIMNEPNLTYRWPGGKASVGWYCQMLGQSWAQLPAADTVITGGLAPAGTGPRSVSVQDWTAAFYHDGCERWADAYGDHPYSFPNLPEQPATWNPWTYLPALHATMVASGGKVLPFWYTEFGAPTKVPDNPAQAVTPAVQAETVTQGFDTARTWTWSGPLFVFTWRPDTTGADFALTAAAVAAFTHEVR